MKRLIILLLLFLLVTCNGCGETSSEGADSARVQEQQKQYQIAQPVPRFDYSLERDVATQLYKARNENVSTWTVWRSDLGTIEGYCASVGYPIPYDTSLTNPLQTATGYQSVTSVEQAEPNGLFSSKNSIATWVRCICEVNGTTVEAPVYIESKVTAYPFPINVDYENNRVKPVVGAKPSVTIEGR